MKIVVVGKGGREHALLLALQDSPTETELYCHPGSDAIAELAERVEAKGVEELVGWMLGKGIDLCIAGEESYLVKEEGLANLCEKAGIPCWGPPKEGAQLEASKAFAKESMAWRQVRGLRFVLMKKQRMIFWEKFSEVGVLGKDVFWLSSFWRGRRFRFLPQSVAIRIRFSLLRGIIRG